MAAWKIWRFLGLLAAIPAGVLTWLAIVRWRMDYNEEGRHFSDSGVVPVVLDTDGRDAWTFLAVIALGIALGCFLLSRWMKPASNK